MAKDTFKPKQIIDANLITEFGGVEELPSFKDEGPGQRNYLYVPGGSDARYNRDVSLLQYAKGEIRASEVKTMDWNPRWFRTVKGTGSDPDNTRVVHAKNQGYRPATKEDIGKPWLTELPPGGMIAPDGSIKTAGGDLALFITDKAQAAHNAMKKKIRTEESVDGMEFTKGGLGTVGKQLKGADPYVEKTIGFQEAHE